MPLLPRLECRETRPPSSSPTSSPCLWVQLPALLIVSGLIAWASRWRVNDAAQVGTADLSHCWGFCQHLPLARTPTHTSPYYLFLSYPSVMLSPDLTFMVTQKWFLEFGGTLREQPLKEAAIHWLAQPVVPASWAFPAPRRLHCHVDLPSSCDSGLALCQLPSSYWS